MLESVIAPWKCDEGDLVEFNFSRIAAAKGKTPLKGVVVSREPKLVSIRVDNSEQTVRIHVSLVRVVKIALTGKRIEKTLGKKFVQKLSNNKTNSEKKEMTNEIGGMVFKYVKKKGVHNAKH
jgi:hypothetical protein